MDKDKYKLWNIDGKYMVDDKESSKICFFVTNDGKIKEYYWGLKQFLDVTDKYIKLDCTGDKDKSMS